MKKIIKAQITNNVLFVEESLTQNPSKNIAGIVKKFSPPKESSLIRRK